jgi:type III secretion protein C
VSAALTGTLSGRFDNVAPGIFLDGLHSAFGVNWYLSGGTIYFYHDSEWAAEVFYPRSLSPVALLEALRGSPAFSLQLPPRLSGAGLVLEGPPSYVEALKSEAAAVDERHSEARLSIRVFKLRYAQADDVTVTSVDRTMTIPGVATILNNMLEGSTAKKNPAVRQNLASVGGLMGQGLASLSESSSTQEDSYQSPVWAGRVMADPRMNAVLVSDFEDRMPYYQAVIEDLDREVHLVEIHAAIVDVNTNFKKDLGVNWQGVATPQNISLGGEMTVDSGSYETLPLPGQAIGQGAIVSTVYTQGDNFFVARIQALEEDGQARLLGRPSVLTLDNQEATLENTTTYYIEVAGYQSVDLFKVDSGTVLRVTPHIIESESGGQPSIRLNVTVQDSQDTGSGTISGNMAIPPVKQTKINTQALIQSGQSLLIGGYYFESRQENESGAPGLKSIPLLGRLFRTNSDSTSQMERMVLITPRIIRLGEVQNLPSHIDDESFSRSPTQANYEPRAPKPRGGCAAR